MSVKALTDHFLTLEKVMKSKYLLVCSCLLTLVFAGLWGYSHFYKNEHTQTEISEYSESKRVPAQAYNQHPNDNGDWSVFSHNIRIKETIREVGDRKLNCVILHNRTGYFYNRAGRLYVAPPSISCTFADPDQLEAITQDGEDNGWWSVFSNNISIKETVREVGNNKLYCVILYYKGGYLNARKNRSLSKTKQYITPPAISCVQ